MEEGGGWIPKPFFEEDKKRLSASSLKVDFRSCLLHHLPIQVLELVQLEILLLSDNFITELPNEISRLSNLKDLWLSHNQLSTLPQSIGGLMKLGVLNAYFNQITSLPKEIGRLTSLRSLNLTKNKLTSLPDTLGNLCSLVSLEVGANKISSLPDSVSKLHSLTSLSLHCNRIRVLPSTIGELHSLVHFNLRCNDLTSLPKTIGGLKKLKSLDVRFNKLELLPDEICQLVSLQELDLYGNKLSRVPFELGNLPNLSIIYLRDNPIVDPPPQIVEQGSEFVIAYLVQKDLVFNNTPPSRERLKTVANLVDSLGNLSLDLIRTDSTGKSNTGATFNLGKSPRHSTISIKGFLSALTHSKERKSTLSIPSHVVIPNRERRRSYTYPAPVFEFVKAFPTSDPTPRREPLLVQHRTRWNENQSSSGFSSDQKEEEEEEGEEEDIDVVGLPSLDVSPPNESTTRTSAIPIPGAKDRDVNMSSLDLSFSPSDTFLREVEPNNRCSPPCTCEQFISERPGEKSGHCKNCGHGAEAHNEVPSFILERIPHQRSSRARSLSESNSGPSRESFLARYEIQNEKIKELENKLMELQSSPSSPIIFPMEAKVQSQPLILNPSWEIDPRELQFREKIGSGQSSKVYSGVFRGQSVAMKVYRGNPQGSDLEGFRKELDVVCAIRSPNIVLYYGAVLQPKICMVLELCELGTLFEVLNKEALSWERAFKFCVEIAKGIHCLHSWKPMVVHRDIKSINLFVDHSYTVKVGDFGLARFVNSGNMSTLGKFRGTYAYCSPEIYFGSTCTFKSDIYSMSIVFWEIFNRALTNNYAMPFRELDVDFEFQVIIYVAQNGVRPTIDSKMPSPIVNLLRQMWSDDPNDRPASGSVIHMIEEMQEAHSSNPKRFLRS